MRKNKLFLGASALVVATLALSGCVENKAATPAADGEGSEALTVSIKDDACGVSAATAPSGTLKFSLKNEGSAPNEFEILAEDKLRIVGERENLGPGTTTDYTIVLEPGTYYTACKKNMVGALVGVAEFKVTDSGKKVEVSADEQQLRDSAVENYTAYIKDQTGQLLDATKAFAAAYLAGNVEEAKALYPSARQYYERIEPTAEAFGDLDPALDEREADWQEDDEKGDREWTGWHVLEKDLWAPEDYTPLDAAAKQKYADKLVADTQALYDAVYADDFAVSLDDISNGAIGLLEEVAISKITGEEEAFSHTDLWDFQANVEGAQVAYGNVEKLAEQKQPELAKEIKTALEDLQAELAEYKSGDGYVFYDTVSEEQRKVLSDKVNALRKPLGDLTGAVLA